MSTATPRKRPNLALNALRTAGLIDPSDSPMKDAGPSRTRRRVLDKPARGRPKPNGIAVRGVGSTAPPARGGPTARPRRDALSKGSDVPSANRPITGSAPGRIMPIELLREFIKQRYNPELRFLNLENMADDELLKSRDILPPDDENASRQIGPALLKLAGQLTPQPESISFANNSFTTLSSLHLLPKFLPQLKNISFQNNELRLWKDLEAIIPHDSKHKEAVSSIREIILMGNPVHDQEVTKGDLTVYRSEIIRRFPNLEMLDQEPIIKIGFDVSLPEITERDRAVQADKQVQWPAATSFLVDMKAGFMGPGIEATTVEFLTKYFELFDSNRSQLTPVYSSTATFSLSLNTSIPPRARIRGYHAHLPRQKELKWAPWMEVGSRNLLRVAKLDKTTTFLRSTAPEVVKALEELPGTKHDVTGTGGATEGTGGTVIGSAAAGKFVVDAFTCLGVLPGEGDAGIVLFVNVHGEFAEQPTGGLRSFDRVFVLAPAAPDSPSYVAGWRVTILSDQLTVRGYSANEAWVPGPIVVQNTNTGKSTPGPGTGPPSAMSSVDMTATLDPIMADLSEPQRALLIECANRTALNAQYSRMCLEGNGWDLAKALANFEELKNTIPPDAFLFSDIATHRRRRLQLGDCHSTTMNSKKGKIDLLVKVRYTNPLPAPPCPPKLLNIPTHPSRYVKPEFTATLAAETPLPMVVDSECGMPLDLFCWDGLWDGRTDYEELNPTEPVELDEADAELLWDPPAHAQVPSSNGQGVLGSVPSTPGHVNVQPNVSWLRRAEYASRSMSRHGSGAEMALEEEVTVDASLPAQIAVIEKSFAALPPLNTVTHPTRKDADGKPLTAATSFELLPDVDIWANPYLQIRFIERPGERPLDVPDPRLDCGILRPQQTEDDEHFISFYLPTEDAEAEAFKDRRRTPTSTLTNETTEFEFQRDYESAKIENDITNEFLVVIDDGPIVNPDGTPVLDGHAGASNGMGETHEPRKKGAYYKAVERKIVLKKKPVIKGQEIDYTDKWDLIKLFHIRIAAEDREERNELQAEVTDPQWTFSRLDAQGEADEEMAAE
ncbi:MRNA export factor mex67 [Ceratobasidium theobromae]|uniref:mRNA export factor MEX67 n=1 Tax=Ceratobasidium theobromae TaxID=1582974 RepID=A0A5N5QX59_9AGAM|nr:MRNA export factor mex67 [Ceratobasidium theobromae]